jgi:PRTRC genetic system protein B
MNKVQVLEGGEKTLAMCAALLLYKSGYGEVYATTHQPIPHPSIPGVQVIGPGYAASKAALAEFAIAVSDATAYRGMIPDNLLYTAPNLIAWWTPAAHRRVWFKSNDEAIGTCAATVFHPPLIFVAGAADWYIYAFESNTRPNAKTKLFKAPYFNVWKDGKICTGNVDLPAALSAEAIPEYERAFFESRFTHSNDPQLAKYDGGGSALWADQMKHPDQQLITQAILIARNETLEQAIKRISTGK